MLITSLFLLVSGALVRKESEQSLSSKASPPDPHLQRFASVTTGNSSDSAPDSLFWRASKEGKTVYLFGVTHYAPHKQAVHFGRQIKEQFKRDGAKIKKYYVENDLGYPLFDNDLIYEVSNHKVLSTYFSPNSFGGNVFPLETKEEWIANHEHEAQEKGLPPQEFYDRVIYTEEPWTWESLQKGGGTSRSVEILMWQTGTLDEGNNEMLSHPQLEAILKAAGVQARNELYTKKVMAEDAAFVTMGCAHLTLSVGKVVGVVELLRMNGWKLDSIPLAPFKERG